MHHYLPKKISQTKIKFYQLEAESLKVKEEHQYVAEHFKKDDFAEFLAFKENRKLLNMEISSILRMLETRKEEESRIKEFKRE
jgi:hypothetical protein